MWELPLLPFERKTTTCFPAEHTGKTPISGLGPIFGNKSGPESQFWPPPQPRSRGLRQAGELRPRSSSGWGKWPPNDPAGQQPLSHPTRWLLHPSLSMPKKEAFVSHFGVPGKSREMTLPQWTLFMFLCLSRMWPGARHLTEAF